MTGVLNLLHRWTAPNPWCCSLRYLRCFTLLLARFAGKDRWNIQNPHAVSQDSSIEDKPGLLSLIAQFDQPAQFSTLVQAGLCNRLKTSSPTSVGLISTLYCAVEASGLSFAITASIYTDSTALSRVDLTKAPFVAAGALIVRSAGSRTYMPNFRMPRAFAYSGSFAMNRLPL